MIDVNGTSVPLIATEEAFAIPEWIEAMRELPRSGPEADEVDVFHLLSGFPGLHERLTNTQLRLDTMDATGVDMHLLGPVSPGVQMFDTEDAIRLARLFNDRMAELVRDHPTRFAALATIATQNPAEAALEAERAITELGMSGVLINSHTGGEYLDDEKFQPLLETIAGLGVPLYIHPRVPAPSLVAPYRANGLLGATWGFAAETGLHILRLITSGVFDKIPTLQVAIGHLGEGIPYYFWRIDHIHDRVIKSSRGTIPELARKPSEYFSSNISITTSGMNWHPALHFCLENVGVDRVQFAIDYPYEDMAESVEFLATAGLDLETIEKVAYRNAAQLFNLKVGQ
jgi:2,3-dihydroxybenzoate decarboxylase